MTAITATVTMIEYPSRVPAPPQFTMLSNALTAYLFRGKLSCTCGKRPYFACLVEDAATLRTEQFWVTFWEQMLAHEKAEIIAEGGVWPGDTPCSPG